METVLENGPPIGRHTFSSDLICQRMLPGPTFPRMGGCNNLLSLIIHICDPIHFAVNVMKRIMALFTADPLKV